MTLTVMVFCLRFLLGKTTKQKRMFLFALISEIPLSAFQIEIVDIHSQNVFWTLTIGLVMLDLIQNGASYVKGHKGKMLQEVWIEGQPIPMVWQFVVVAVCACVAQALQTDYGAGWHLIDLFYLDAA